MESAATECFELKLGSEALKPVGFTAELTNNKWMLPSKMI